MIRQSCCSRCPRIAASSLNTGSARSWRLSSICVIMCCMAPSLPLSVTGGCPFSYFLRYGLSLRRVRTDIDETSIGALSHHLLEQLCARLGKQYAHAGTAQLPELIDALVCRCGAAFPAPAL